MSKTIITIEHTCHGQPRPYADSQYGAKIKAERHGVYTDGRVIPIQLETEEVKELTQKFVHPFVEGGHWYQPRLQLIQEGPDKSWEVLVIREYTD